MDSILDFQLPQNRSNVIKVIGTGGGGNNAINHMYRQGIAGVDFVVCNTDRQALEKSPVPNKIQLGKTISEGLGAGADPNIGEQAALESEDEIRAVLGPMTKMAFITAGMGGGTGTGSAPVIARICRELDILTVAIVTMPFNFEGRSRTDQARKGIEKLRKHVDSLIVINNDKLREIYGNLTMTNAYSKADEILSTASRSIAEVITRHYHINIDLKDAATVLKDSGTAIMGSKAASGDDRAKVAVMGALDSPLLNDNRVAGAKNVLVLIVSSTEDEATMDEIDLINSHIQHQAGDGVNIIMGAGTEDMERETLSVTVIASGFPADQQQEITNNEPRRVIHSLDDDAPARVNLTDNTVVHQAPATPTPPQRIVHELRLDDDTPADPDMHQSPIADESHMTSQPKAEEMEQPHGMDLTMPAASTLPFQVFETPTPIIPQEQLDENQQLLDQKQQETEAVQPLETDLSGQSLEPEQPRVVASISLDGEVNHYDEKTGKTQQPQLAMSLDIPVEYTEVTTPVAEEPITTRFEIIDRDVQVEQQEESNESAHFLDFGTPTHVQEEADNALAAQTPAPQAEVPPARPAISSIEVNKAVELTNITENTREGIKRYTLESYVDEKDQITPIAAPEKPAQSFSMELRDKQEQPSTPMPTDDNPLRASLVKSAEKRRMTLKRNNYRFKNVNVNDMDKEPAYKRAGIELQETHKERVSRTSLGTDEKGNPKLGDRNSYLHDNVD